MPSGQFTLKIICPRAQQINRKRKSGNIFAEYITVHESRISVRKKSRNKIFEKCCCVATSAFVEKYRCIAPDKYFCIAPDKIPLGANLNIFHFGRCGNSIVVPSSDCSPPSFFASAVLALSLFLSVSLSLSVSLFVFLLFIPLS